MRVERMIGRSATVVALFALSGIARTLGAQAANDGPAGGRPGGYRPGIDVVDYDLSMDLPDSGSTIQGRAVLTVKRTARVDTLMLDLIDLRVDSVLVNNRATTFRRTSNAIAIPLPGGSGDVLSVAVRYGGAPKFGLIIKTDSLGRWSAFGDNWPNRARYWIPSVDHPSDKATVTWTVRAPAKLQVIANGRREEERPIGNGRMLTRWRESRPIAPYLMVIAAAPLAYLDLGRGACGESEFGCVDHGVYYFAEERSYVPGPFANSVAIVDFFSSLVGPFPYEKLAHLQSSTTYGGMENASAIFYADVIFKKHQNAVGTVAHETAHQWFGDAVTEREWAHLWLSEGFATYFAALWTEHSQGDSAFRAEMAQIRQQIATNPIAAQRPVIDTAQTDYMALLNINSYQKGGWVLHMLRRMIGDSAFFGGLRNYQKKYRDANALTDDLRRELEATSHTDLAWYFDQWLRRPGFPELTTSWRYDASQRRVILAIAQGSRFAPYRVPLTVEVIDATGTARRATVQVAATATQSVTLPLELSAAPRSLRFDPDVDLLATFTTH